VVSRKAEYLKMAGQWIERLDQSATAGTNLRVYRLRFGDARKIAALLNDIFVGRTGSGLDSLGSQIAPGGGLSTSTSRTTSRGPLSALSFPSQTGGGPGGLGGGAAPPSTAPVGTPLHRAATAHGRTCGPHS